MKIAAIVPAAGRGSRMNHRLPKQYLPLGGIPIIARTLIALESFAAIDEIFVVVREEEKEYFHREIVRKYNLDKVSRIIAGGERRQDSVYKGLECTGEDTTLIAIHDGVRPFVTEDIFMETIAQAALHKAAIVAVPVSDTIKVAKQHGFAGSTLPRDELWAVQTPQVFERGLILKAHHLARKENFTGTDDASLVEKMSCPVKIVEGAHENIKITTPGDLIIAEAILREFGK